MRPPTLSQPFAQSAPLQRPALLRQSILFGICPASAIRPLQDLPHCGDPPFTESALL